MNNRRVRKVRISDDPEEAYRAALKTAFNIIGYKDNTVAQVRGKLLERGYAEATVSDVIEFLTAKRYLDDERMLLRTVRMLAEKKLYGKARIRRELQRKQFDPEVLVSLDFDDGELSEIDFAEICLHLIKKRGGMKDEKTYAFLLRYGHSGSDIRMAYRRLAEEIMDCEDEEYDKA